MLFNGRDGHRLSLDKKVKVILLKSSSYTIAKSENKLQSRIMRFFHFCITKS